MKQLLCIFIGLLFISCSYDKNKKLTNQLTEDDFFKITQNNDIDDEEDYWSKSNQSLTNEIPDIFKQKVNISITKKLNVEEAIIKLAESINLNIQINCDIKSKIYLNVKNQPFIDVIKNICDINHLKYTINGESLSIDNDIPFLKTYNVQFLNILRKSNSSISTNTDIFAQNTIGNSLGNSSGGGSENGSSNNVVNSDDNNFWLELTANLKNIVNSKISIHKQAGLITVHATLKEHKIIEEYLKKLIKVVNSQVIIEAKILEVSLNKNYSHGIDWDLSRKLSTSFTNIQEQKFSSTPNGLFSIGIKSKNLNGFIKFIEQFGSVKTLSSPRITVMNNQTAILKVAKQEVYFNLIYNNNYLARGVNNNHGYNSETFYSNINTVPVGIVLSVHPVIDLDTGTITMTLRPSISKVVDFKNDPSIAMNWNSVNSSSTTPPVSSIPVVEVREIDSVLNTKSGEIILLGGLMQDSSKFNEYSNLFGSLNKTLNNNSLERNLTEIIILLKAKIVRNKNPPKRDIKLLNQLSNNKPGDKQ